MGNNQDLEVVSYIMHMYHYMNGDIEQLDRISEPSSTTTDQTTQSPDNPSMQFDFENAKYQLAIPITLALFSIAETVGTLLRNSANIPAKKVKASFGETAKNLKTFFARTEICEKKIEAMTYLFRHGISHAYFPKLGLALSYDKNNPNRSLFYKKSNGEIVLNVNILKDIVMSVLLEVKENPELHEDMNKRYEDLKQYNEKDRPYIFDVFCN